MRRLLAAGLWVCLLAPVTSCSSGQPQTSGTKTNWLRACEVNLDCGGDGECLCGLCTAACDEGQVCEGGSCGSALATSIQCGAGATAPAHICLPSPDEGGAECNEFALSHQPELGPAAAADCEQAEALLCESFDGPVPERASTWIEGDMSASLQDCLVHSGSGALRYRGSGDGVNDTFSQTRFRLSEPVGSGPLHARLYLRIPGDVTLPAHLQVLELWDGEDGSEDRVTLFLRPDGLPHVYVGASDETLIAPVEYVLPRDVWVCLEMAVTVDAAAGGAALSMNGSQVAHRSGFRTLGAGPFHVAVIEALLTPDAQDVELYVDELVVATAPIGCP